ncbi:hypothetical protein [Nocardioides sp. W7]|uniref:hypothetical protein n=1 Tax=Nocardioides sp. W7 TaxID=2931390 RepID=UPI001FD0FCF4|nr:hypothetical protein [Nocardioides sp. W7]
MSAPRLPLVVLALLATAVLVAASLAVLDGRHPSPRVEAAPEAVPARAEAAAVLADWDRRRAAAWAAGDPAGLGRLYTPGSRAGREDVAMLRRWVDRGLRVTGLRMQVLDVRADNRQGPRWELVVTDRLAGGQAVGRRTRTALPRDGWSTRRIVLEQTRGEWRVGAVRTLPARPSAPR